MVLENMENKKNILELQPNKPLSIEKVEDCLLTSLNARTIWSVGALCTGNGYVREDAADGGEWFFYKNIEGGRVTAPRKRDFIDVNCWSSDGTTVAQLTTF